MSPRPVPGSDAANHNMYIPSSVQQAMSKQMERAVPAHLKQYVGSSPPGYIPPRVQQELTSYMQKAAPSHLQQYAGAYVQQNVVEAGMRSSMSQRTSAAPAPLATNPRNLGRTSAIPGEQANAAQFLNMFQPDAAEPNTRGQARINRQQSAAPTSPDPNAQPLPQPSQAYPPQQPTPESPTAHYDFILNPAPVPKGPALSGGGGSMFKRISVIAGLGVVLIIAFMVVSSLLGGSSTSTTALTSVAQEQTELLRVAGQASGNSNTPKIEELANATSLSVTSAQQQLLTYLSKNNLKIDLKTLGLKHSLQTDKTLANAIATSTFDAAYTNAMQADLTSYAQSIKTAYSATSGPNGKALLNKEYNGAVLLLEQSKQ